MANISRFAARAMLDWSLKSTTAPATPANIFLGLALGAVGTHPDASSEIGTGSGYVRQSMAFATCVTAAGSCSASNSSAQTFGPFSSSQNVSGIFISDTVSSNAGNMYWGGNLAAVRTPSSGDQLVLAAGALAITLN